MAYSDKNASTERKKPIHLFSGGGTEQGKLETALPELGYAISREWARVNKV
jgi:hypothetical protein